MQEYPKYEVISNEERANRDPLGRHRVTLLGNSVIIRADQFPPAPEVIDIQEDITLETIQGEESADG